MPSPLHLYLGECLPRGVFRVRQDERLPGIRQGGGEPVADGRVVVGDENGLDSRHRYGRNRE